MLHIGAECETNIIGLSVDFDDAEGADIHAGRSLPRAYSAVRGPDNSVSMSIVDTIDQVSKDVS